VRPAVPGIDRRLALTNREDSKWTETKFLLVSRGFHWIQEYPFNR
jgi:hypothetical protein